MPSDESRIVAVLHDVVEDSDVALECLRKEGFNERVLAAVDSLTKRKDEDYDTFIDRVSKNPLAREVKIEDARSLRVRKK